MQTIIAEKPSVAGEIARIVGAKKREDGFISGNGYYVTWAFGHLMALADTDAYGFTGGWKETPLPVLPDEFKITPIILKDKKSNELYKKQLRTIANLFKKSDNIIVATDAGREGELIFRYIYEYLSEKEHIRTPFTRLWISSLTDKSIREGLRQLKPGSDYDNLFQAGKSRSEADWLIGINGTRATTLNVDDGSVWSVGRVQTPTLCMVCRRYLENRNFISEPFFTLRISGTKNGLPFFGLNPTKFKERQEVERILADLLSERKATVLSVEKKPGFSTPPLLHDLTSLQKEANSKFGMSADLTLKLCQSLYEKKLVTYPRTGSRYIPDDVFATLPELVANAASYPRFSDYARLMNGKPFGKISVNAAKVTDHHALLPTENTPKDGQMTDPERKIYELIVGRMLESISPREEKDITTAILQIASHPEYPFTVKGTVIRSPGWKAVMNDNSRTDEEENEKLPPLEKGEILPLENVVIQDKHTKAPPLLTENTLLALMETAGKELDNEEEREALKNIGIGTPATRAETIEKLIRTQYMERDKKTLVPTAKGLALYETVKDMLIANVEMTGKWESALNRIESGKLDAAVFNRDIRSYTVKCTEELMNLKIDNSHIRPTTQKRLELVCPRCGSPFVVSEKICACTNKQTCGFFFWRVVCQRHLTEKDISEILLHGQTADKVSLKRKDGKIFKAILVLQPDGKFTFKW